MNHSDPKWLSFLSKKIPWLGIPHISIILITLQVFGFFLILSSPGWMNTLALLPGRALHGELWRWITFLSIPVSYSPIWFIFALFFMYSILNSIESLWGDFKTTFYILVSVILTIVFSSVTGYPVTQTTDFNSTLFLAAAALFPENEIQLYMVFPVKLKYLGWLTLAFLGYRFLQGEWIDRLFLLTIYSNYLLFFGPTLLQRLKQWKRRKDYQKSFRR